MGGGGGRGLTLAGTLAEDKVCHTGPIRLHPSPIRRSITQPLSLSDSFLPPPLPARRPQDREAGPESLTASATTTGPRGPRARSPGPPAARAGTPHPKGPLTRPLPRAQFLLHQLRLPCRCPSRGVPTPPLTVITTNQHTCLLGACGCTGVRRLPLSAAGAPTTLGNRGHGDPHFRDEETEAQRG